VLVIDTRQHPAHGRDLIERIRKITDKPVKWAINTHAHGDHFLGNVAFRSIGTTIIAHRDTVAGIVKNQTLYVQAGAGVVADSVPEMEWRETEVKARALIRAAELVEEGF